LTKKQQFTPLVEVIIDAIQDVKGQNILVLDLQEMENSSCAFFVICEGNSDTQVGAITDRIERKTREVLKERPWHIEGRQNAEWVLIDYVSTVVHVFKKETRAFYALEELWGDAPSFEIVE
jgi:ribosome-associated protein